MVPKLTIVVPAGQRFSTDQIALVPSSFVYNRARVNNSLFALRLARGGKRGQRATRAITLVASTGTESSARLVAEYLIKFSTGALLVFVAWYVPSSLPASTWPDESDGAWRTRTSVAFHRADMGAAF